MVTHSFYLSDPRVRREAETLARNGHSVDVLCIRKPGEPRRETVNGVNIIRMPLGKKRGSALRYVIDYTASMIIAFFYLSALHLRRRWDLVQVHTPPDGLLLSAIVCKLTGAALLLDLHDPMPEAMRTKFGDRFSPMINRIVVLQEWLATRIADHVITVTEQVREALIERGLKPEKVSIVMNFADNAIFAGRASLADDDAPRGDRPPVIVYMGTLTRQYGVDVAVDALALLRRRLPDARLRVIGDGEERERLEEQVRRLSLDGAVEFTGSVPITRIPDVALPADVGVAPHRRDRLYDMCFPSKIYDYLSLGLPVVACRTDSLEYYYGDGTIGFFESEDAAGLARAIEDVLASADARAEMRRRARGFLEARNWMTESRSYLSVVDRLTRSLTSTVEGATR